MVKNMPVALQLYSVRDDLAADFKGTLRRVKELGYEGVEFAGLCGLEAKDIRAMLDEIGLKGMSAHVPIDELLADIGKAVDDYKTIGCRYVAIPWLDENRRPGHPGYEKTLADIRAIAQECAKRDMLLLYHNHDFEFTKVDGVYALDRMYDAIPADLLQTELDTCWVNVAGESPVAYVKKYAGRAPVVHLKDFVMPGKKPAHLYALIGVDEEEKTQEDSVFEFRPLGHGAQDIPAIVDASVDAGAQWVVVEQDEPSMGKTPMECAAMSMEYLKSIG